MVLTRGATPAGDSAPDPAGAALWAAVRSLQADGHQRLTVVDLDTDRPDAATLLAAITSDEPQLAMRGEELLAPRLLRTPVDGRPRPATPERPGTVVVTGTDTPAGAALAHHLATVHRATDLLLVHAPGTTDGTDPDAWPAGTRARRVSTDATGLREALADAHPVSLAVHTADDPDLARTLDELLGDTGEFVTVTDGAATPGRPGRPGPCDTRRPHRGRHAHPPAAGTGRHPRLGRRRRPRPTRRPARRVRHSCSPAGPRPLRPPPGPARPVPAGPRDPPRPHRAAGRAGLAPTLPSPPPCART